MNAGTHILFVCLGNICRSPCARFIFEQMIAKAGLAGKISADSCGTAAFNLGRPVDSRAKAAIVKRGYSPKEHRARQICDEDFQRSDYILVMDRSNLSNIQAWAPAGYDGVIALLGEYRQGGGELTDPYYQGQDAFEAMIDGLEETCNGLLEHLQRERGSK